MARVLHARGSGRIQELGLVDRGDDGRGRSCSSRPKFINLITYNNYVCRVLCRGGVSQRNALAPMAKEVLAL